MWSQFNVKVRGPWSRNEEFLTFSEWSEEGGVKIGALDGAGQRLGTYGIVHILHY